MHVEVLLPKWGMNMQEATVTEWLVNEGDTVTEDETIVTVETEKVNGDVPAPATGTVVKLHAAEGDVVEVGAVLAVIETDQ